VRGHAYDTSCFVAASGVGLKNHSICSFHETIPENRRIFSNSAREIERLPST